MRVGPAHPSHYQWIAERAGLFIGPAFRAIEAIDDSGRIHGMVGYDGWTDNAAHMHVALAHPAAARHLLGPAFRIPFAELGKGLVIATVLSTNARSLALMPGLGFVEKCRIRDGQKVGVDIVLFEMRREQCRWLSREPLRKAG